MATRPSAWARRPKKKGQPTEENAAIAAESDSATSPLNLTQLDSGRRVVLHAASHDTDTTSTDFELAELTQQQTRTSREWPHHGGIWPCGGGPACSSNPLFSLSSSWSRTERRRKSPRLPRIAAAGFLAKCPIYWIRIDPTAEWLAAATVAQPSHMWGHQLSRSREVGLSISSAGSSLFCPSNSPPASFLWLLLSLALDGRRRHSTRGLACMGPALVQVRPFMVIKVQMGCFLMEHLFPPGNVCCTPRLCGCCR